MKAKNKKVMLNVASNARLASNEIEVSEGTNGKKTSFIFNKCSYQK
jgi:hypothetical protein